MFETFFLLFGIAFSLRVYVLSIRPSGYSPLRKFLIFTISLIGITGTLWLFGVLTAHVLRKFHILP